MPRRVAKASDRTIRRGQLNSVRKATPGLKASRLPVIYKDLRRIYRRRGSIPAPALTDSKSAEEDPDHGRGASAEFVNLRRVLPAGFREVRASAAPAAHDRGDLLHDPPRLDPGRQILGDRDDERDLAFV